MDKQDKINKLMSNGVINMNDDSIALLDLIKDDNLIIDTAVDDNLKEPIYTSISSSDGNLHTVWAEKANYLNNDNIGEGLENIKAGMEDSDNDPVPDERTYKLTLKKAAPGQLGGIKLPENANGENSSIVISPDGDIDVNFDKIAKENIASSDKLGVVKIGKHIKIDNEGAITYDPYELPVATDERLGGIKVGNGLKMTADNENEGRKPRLNVYSTAFKNHGFMQEDDPESFDDETILETTKLDFILGKILDYIEKLSKKYDNCYSQLETLLDFNPTVHGGIIVGNGRFKGRSGVVGSEEFTVKFTDKVIELLEKVPTDNQGNIIGEAIGVNYRIILTQSSSILGDLGDYAVTEKSKLGFKVQCTGKNGNLDQFSWILIPDRIEFLDNVDAETGLFEYQTEAGKQPFLDPYGKVIPLSVNKLPIQFGHGIFNGDKVNTKFGERYFSRVNFNKRFPVKDYAVIITPTKLPGMNDNIDENEGVLGEYFVDYVNKTEGYFDVLCTGKSELVPGIEFDWIAVPIGDTSDVIDKCEYVYDPAILPIRAGLVDSKPSADGSKDVIHVNLGRTLYENKQYSILCQLITDTDGKVGEYCGNFDEKLRDSFYIKYTGIVDMPFRMSWVTFDKVNMDSLFFTGCDCEDCKEKTETGTNIEKEKE